MNVKQSFGVHTTVSQVDGMTAVTYHHTHVVKFDDEKIILNSGGYKTATTKKRMNQTSYAFGLGYQVFQSDFDWFVDYNGEILEFSDNMALKRR